MLVELCISLPMLYLPMQILSWDFFSKAEPSRRPVDVPEEGVELSGDLRGFLRTTYGSGGGSGKAGRIRTSNKGKSIVGKYLGKTYSWLTGHSRRK